MDDSLKGRIFIGNPSLEEIKSYFMREKRLADIRRLERQPSASSDIEELSESFEIYLKQKRKKIEDEKTRLATVSKDENRENASLIPDTAPVLDVESSEIIEIDADDSFLELEKLCENTLTLNNVSEHLTDLTSLDSSYLAEEFTKKKLSMNSPKNSPYRKTAYENRPSTIMEVTELSTTTKSSTSSYQTAASALYEKSECYQTANEESWVSGNALVKKRAGSFYNDTMDFTKDSLESTQKAVISNSMQITNDSLNEQSSSANKSTTFENDENISFNMSHERLDDTLEAIERILAQGAMMKSPKKTPLKLSNPATPQSSQHHAITLKSSPTPWSSTKNFKPVFARITPSNSPLIKFSPSATKNPVSNFKQPLSLSKTPQFASTHSKKFQHIVSPIARYINNTPELPLCTHSQFGVGSSRTHHNFRDSDSFVKEKINLPSSGLTLPMRAKTKSSNPDFNSGDKRILGGEKFQKLFLKHSNASVAAHKKVPAKVPSQLFHDNTLANETLLSDVSFPALPVDDSILVIEEIKRIK